MEGSAEYTKWLPQDAANFTGINPNTGEGVEVFGSMLSGVKKSEKKQQNPPKTIFINKYTGKTLFELSNFEKDTDLNLWKQF